jgi:hypothetical protein
MGRTGRKEEGGRRMEEGGMEDEMVPSSILHPPPSRWRRARALAIASSRLDPNFGEEVMHVTREEIVKLTDLASCAG